MIPILAQLGDLHAEPLQPFGHTARLPLRNGPDLGICRARDRSIVLAEQLRKEGVNRPFPLRHVGDDHRVGGARAIGYSSRRAWLDLAQRQQRQRKQPAGRASSTEPRDGTVRRQDLTTAWITTASLDGSTGAAEKWGLIAVKSSQEPSEAKRLAPCRRGGRAHRHARPTWLILQAEISTLFAFANGQGRVHAASRRPPISRPRLKARLKKSHPPPGLVPPRRSSGRIAQQGLGGDGPRRAGQARR